MRRALGACLVAVLVVFCAACELPSASSDPTARVSATVGPTGTAPAFEGVPPLNVLPVGVSEQAITVGGQIRMYRAYRPARLVPLAPLVVMLHGGLGSARLAQQHYGWDRVADREGFVVLYPDGIGQSWHAGGDCCGVAASTGLDDVGFVRDAIADLRGRVSIDPGRVFAAGMSAGGMMAYRLACDTTLFAAVGAVAATLVGDCPNPGPVSVIHIHGTADTTVPYLGPTGTGLAEIPGSPIPALHDRWRTVDRCGGDVVQTSGNLTTSTASCPSNRSVVLVTVEGLGHEWPGVAGRGPLDSRPSASVTPTSPSTPPTSTPTSRPASTPSTTVTGAGLPPGGDATAAPAYHATEALWTFFDAHARP